jgi:hypothetical protein
MLWKKTGWFPYGPADTVARTESVTEEPLFGSKPRFW